MLHSAIHEARPDVVAAAHSHSVHGKAFSALGIPLDPITQDSCIFYEDHTVITEQGGAVVLEVEAGQEIAAAFGHRQGGDPPEPRAVHRRRDGRRGGVLVPQHGAQLPGAAAGDGRRHAEADRARDWPSTRPSRPGSRSPAGSASSRCGRRSAAPIPTCSTDPTLPPSARGRPGGSARRDRLAGGAVRHLRDRPVHGRDDRGEPVRRGPPGDRRLVARARRRACVVLAVSVRSQRRWTPRRPLAAAAVRHRDRGDEPVLLPGDRPARARQERRRSSSSGRSPSPPCSTRTRAQHRRAGARRRRRGRAVRRRARRRAARPCCSSSPRRRCGPAYIVLGRRVADLDRGMSGLARRPADRRGSC